MTIWGLLGDDLRTINLGRLGNNIGLGQFGDDLSLRPPSDQLGTTD